MRLVMTIMMYKLMDVIFVRRSIVAIRWMILMRIVINRLILKDVLIVHLILDGHVHKGNVHRYLGMEFESNLMKNVMMAIRKITMDVHLKWFLNLGLHVFENQKDRIIMKAGTQFVKSKIKQLEALQQLMLSQDFWS